VLVLGNAKLLVCEQVELLVISVQLHLLPMTFTDDNIPAEDLLRKRIVLEEDLDPMLHPKRIVLSALLFRYHLKITIRVEIAIAWGLREMVLV
jgi:hypothetical protein